MVEAIDRKALMEEFNNLELKEVITVTLKGRKKIDWEEVTVSQKYLSEEEMWRDLYDRQKLSFREISRLIHVSNVGVANRIKQVLGKEVIRRKGGVHNLSGIRMTEMRLQKFNLTLPEAFKKYGNLREVAMSLEIPVFRIYAYAKYKGFKEKPITRRRGGELNVPVDK